MWIGCPSADGPDARAAAPSRRPRRLAAEVRGPGVRSLGLAVGPGAQVSLNLVDVALAPPDVVYDRVAAGVEALGCTVLGAELVGLCPTRSLRRCRATGGPSSTSPRTGR